ncbi:hypothetical protein FQR65_LT16034 [Abscondita terminalis]|nr:hypothetical protein FQR65_LT16034 [Abscondita terminalis]
MIINLRDDLLAFKDSTIQDRIRVLRKLKRRINQLQKSKLKSVKFQEEIPEPFRYVPYEEDAHFQTIPVPDTPVVDTTVLQPPVPDSNIADPETLISELRRSKRTIKQPAKFNDYVLR